jgi:hypothetical protein
MSFPLTQTVVLSIAAAVLALILMTWLITRLVFARRLQVLNERLTNSQRERDELARQLTALRSSVKGGARGNASVEAIHCVTDRYSSRRYRRACGLYRRAY